ncbi:MAG: aspartate--tRNA(Asn) ligase [Candidatus Dojkabacteria bacterium]|nr:aspartate--tRNA(Asn) ligase [Candidatus Dojkabacteria bacterium]
MERTYITDLKEKIGEEIRIRGRVDTIRDQGKIIFLVIRDKTGKVQTVAWHQDEEVFQNAKHLTQESVVDITGEVKEAQQVEAGYEVAIKDLKIDSLSKMPLPITLEDEHVDNVSALDKRLDYRWIDLRSQKNQLMVAVNTLIAQTMRTYCVEYGLKEIQGPRIISAASEGGANVFEVKYFDRKAYLAQSPQFHKQMGIASDLEGVFNVGPVFRAEKSFTTRHLTEYTSFDVELGYIDSYKDVMKFEEGLIRKTLEEVKEKYGDKIKEVFNVEINVPEQEFSVVTVKEAKEKLANKGVTSKAEGDFSPEEEKAMGEIVKEETGSEFFFMVDYPHSQRAFYHMKNPEDKSLALGYDLFWKGLEITTGAQREHREEELIESAVERGIKEDTLEDYFEYFKYGCPPHGGFAIGTERFLMQLLNLGSILEATYLPNTPNRIGKLIARQN